MATAWYQQIYTSKRFKLGTTKWQNGNEYVFCSGVASLAAGDFVQITGSTFAMAQLSTTGPTSGLVGVSMAANTSATNYSWAQVAGRYATANITTHSSGAGKVLFATSTGGRTIITPTTEATVYGAFTDGNAASNVGPVQLSNPQYPGDIST